MQLERTNGKAQPESAEQFFDLLTPKQLAERLNLPETWVRDQTRARTIDRIPHIKFGRYCRFQWLSPALRAWIERRCKGGK